MFADCGKPEVRDVQGLLTMELAGRLSNPGFLRRIESLAVRDR